MLTTVPQPCSPTRSRLSAGLGHAYATLGLRAREARVDAIRSAAGAASKKIRQVAESDCEQDCLLAEVALSTYRLLDPRQRSRQIERIQLSIFSERAMELQALSRRPLLPANQRSEAPMLHSA